MTLLTSGLEFDEIVGYDLEHIFTFISDTLFLTQSISIPSGKFISASHDSLDIRFDDHVTIRNLQTDFYYSYLRQYTFSISANRNDLFKVKSFLNYYRFDPFTIDYNGKKYTAYLDYTDNTIQSLDLYNPNPTMLVDFIVL